MVRKIFQPHVSSSKILVGYVTTPSASRLYSVDNRMINKCGAIDGMRNGRGNRSIRRKPAPVPATPT
jgi:hypothetical protein